MRLPARPPPGELRFWRVDIDAERRRLDVDLSEAELARRRASWKPHAPAYTSGVLAKYAKLVSSSSLGAVTDG